MIDDSNCRLCSVFSVSVSRFMRQRCAVNSERHFSPYFVLMCYKCFGTSVSLYGLYTPSSTMIRCMCLHRHGCFVNPATQITPFSLPFIPFVPTALSLLSQWKQWIRLFVQLYTLDGTVSNTHTSCVCRNCVSCITYMKIQSLLECDAVSLGNWPLTSFFL
jgi:hypothetical protein